MARALRPHVGGLALSVGIDQAAVVAVVQQRRQFQAPKARVIERAVRVQAALDQIDLGAVLQQLLDDAQARAQVADADEALAVAEDARHGLRHGHEFAHRQPARTRVGLDGAQQVFEPRQVLIGHVGVVQHHADRRARTVVGDAAREFVRDARQGVIFALLCGQAQLLAPVDIDRDLGQPALRDGIAAARAVARQRAKTKLGEQRRRGRAAAIPRRREDRVERVAKPRAQALAACGEVIALRVDAARAAEFALASGGFVVDVRKAMLVHADQFRRGARCLHDLVAA
jgi:hypothetical protein